MNDINNMRFILHVSDFHLSDDEDTNKQARAALKAVTQMLKKEGCRIEYLIHTGDVINSGDLFDSLARKYNIPDEFWEETEDKTKDGKVIKRFMHEEYAKAAQGNSTKLNEEDESIDWSTATPTLNHLDAFDAEVRRIVIERFSKAEEVLRDFVTDLNVSFGNVVICSGNHDVLRPLSVNNDEIICTKIANDEYKYVGSQKTNDIMEPFNNFLNSLKTANSTSRYSDTDDSCSQLGSVSCCTLDDLNILILNTNWINPRKQKPGYYCVRCDCIKKAIENCKIDQKRNRLNVILAHKPIYEICEKVRLSYKKYTKTSFLSKLQGFAGPDGIYLCGDKHTRSIISSYFHDIPHYIGGEPISVKIGEQSDVEYNLIAVSEGKVSMERKIHLSCDANGKWRCEIRPQDETVKSLYDLSKKYIIDNTFEAQGIKTVCPTWEKLYQEICSWSESNRNKWYENIENLYRAICRYRNNGMPTKNDLPTDALIFDFVQKRLNEKIILQESKNILNIRGEHSSSKSMFLGLFYIHLMMSYSTGKIDFIPAYFNLESEEIYKKIESVGSYYKAITDVFNEFTEKVQDIAKKEHLPICYFIDGLDELDCWSLSTEDSVGRGILNILAKYDNAWYVMAFSQHNLPRYKNTMPTRMYSDTSDIMYFNPLEVSDDGAEDTYFPSFIKSFLQIRNYNNQNELPENLVKDVCNIIRKFRRLTITPGFVYQNYDFITKLKAKDVLQHKDDDHLTVYSYYIDRQNERCLEQLGYGYVNYAPAMAYYFSYKGFTYERFMHIKRDNVLCERHELKLICENDNEKKIYPAFLFIKKNKEAREFLIAMHYNRELRYYAEHPNEMIEADSILNEFITHNIAVIIRNLWVDVNKFVIACEQLLQREELGNCTLSMLIYCLMNINIYEPIRNKLQIQMCKKGKEILTKQGLWDDTMDPDSVQLPDEDVVLEKAWEIHGKNDAEKMELFLQLGLRHSLELFNFIDAPKDICEKYLNTKSFWAYNRQHQMLYYGDLSNKNDANVHPLKPGVDVAYSGFDFHDCFNSLSVKIKNDPTCQLNKYHLVTLCDLINHRIDKNYLNEECKLTDNDIRNTFFYRDKDTHRAQKVLDRISVLIQKSISDTKITQHSVIVKCQNLIAQYRKKSGTEIHGIHEEKITQ